MKSIQPSLENINKEQDTKMTVNQLKLFTKILRQTLLDAGIEKVTTDHALKQAIIKFNKKKNLTTSKTPPTPHTTSFDAKENRGIDPIGRILVEFCFIKSPKKRMIWPDNSVQDDTARKKFTQGIIPRPLMRYFLISVRGSIPEIDQLESSSVLFGKDNESHKKRKILVNDLLKEFRNKNPHTDKLNWEEIYLDSRFQKIALEIIGDIRRKMNQFGVDRYLKILENFRQRDPAQKSINKMQRHFIVTDAKQIDEALWAAESSLAQIIK
ncbi:hypothetical protein [uncultured Pseudodesulfovibrio sp.]|uniref:hypothetical protein n=1 Tax=uncultured Pseudodesulfovibrio sp. TaxID=2035858 RepID=UPI0029C8050B|nr:hypothetical protein [uncultured Pseudodesulfovibrio sp.]